MGNINLIKPRKQKKALLKNSKNIKQIADMYYEQTSFTDVVKDRTYEKVYYVHYVDDIFKQFGISSSNELMFLLHWGIGEKFSECEFCGLSKTQVKTRGGYSVIDCEHKGSCLTCKKPYVHANENGVCYECFDREAAEFHKRNEPDCKRHRFLQAVGNHEYIILMKKNRDVEELKLMKSIASDYYHLFDQLIGEIQYNH